MQTSTIYRNNQDGGKIQEMLEKKEEFEKAAPPQPGLREANWKGVYEYQQANMLSDRSAATNNGQVN